MEAESGITGLTKSSGMRALKYASIALAIALTVTTLASRISLINTHLLNIMGEEQNVVYGIIKWMQGSPLYTDPAILPMDIIQYAPSYYYLPAKWVQFGGSVYCGVRLYSVSYPYRSTAGPIP